MLKELRLPLNDSVVLPSLPPKMTRIFKNDKSRQTRLVSVLGTVFFFHRKVTKRAPSIPVHPSLRFPSADILRHHAVHLSHLRNQRGALLLTELHSLFTLRLVVSLMSFFCPGNPSRISHYPISPSCGPSRLCSASFSDLPCF